MTPFLGPAFIAAVAYVDPGNFATNFAAGAGHGYELVWVVVLADAVALLVQSVTSKAGLVTGRSLPELCRGRFGRPANLALWVQAEVVAMATDLAELVGAAVGLHLLFSLALPPAGVVTAVVAFAVLALEQRGYRRFELAVLALLLLVTAGFLVDVLAVGHQSAAGLAAGLVRRLGGNGTLTLAVGIVGATVMPHVVYLHSALQTSRIRPADAGEASVLLRYNRWDCVAGLGLAGLVNVLMLCVAAGLFHGHGGPASLAAVHARLAHAAGGLAALAFAVALMASGLSSSSVGTYAGQVVLRGFTGWRIPLVVRRAVTMAPSLLVLGLAGSVTGALVASQVVLAFGIPFALVPLALLSRGGPLGHSANGAWTQAALWAVTACVSGLDLWLVARSAGLA